MNSDRIKQPLMSFIRSALNRIDYYAYYKCKVVSQSSDGATVDLMPEDKRIPSLSKVTLRVGLPGTVAKFASGAFLMLGWESGDPRKPYALAGFAGGETVQEIEIGGSSAQFVALAPKVQAWFDAFNAAVSGWTPVPNDGGAALKTALMALIGGAPSTDVAAQKVKVA